MGDKGKGIVTKLYKFCDHSQRNKTEGPQNYESDLGRLHFFSYSGKIQGNYLLGVSYILWDYFKSYKISTIGKFQK